MKVRHRSPGVIVILALTLAMALGTGFSQSARAASVDVAMFYDDLAPYGQWVDYQDYGPVWVPSNVSNDWRPYTDGRWVPTNNGYVFETQEPWGWATYHYGNWMPTPGYGWVWSPGRTWYPSTVEWRTTPDTYAADNSYVGWAPIPPSNYVPPYGYAPAGYYSGMPTSSLLTSPFWIFAEAASFLLGFGQPYVPAYSYMYQPVLVPPYYVPVFFGQTVGISSYYSPSYYPGSFFAPGLVGAYSWGPSVSYVSRYSNINPTVFNQTINNNTVNITRINNVMAPAAVLGRNAGIRNIQPPALTQGQALPAARQISNVNQARANLGKTNLVAAPTNVRPLSAQIPKAPATAAQAVRTGTPGTALPASSMMKLSPQQQAQIQKVPAQQRINPVTPTLRGTATGQPTAPGAAGKTGAAQPGTFVRPGGAPATSAKTGAMQPGGAQPGAATGARPGGTGATTTGPGGPGKPGGGQPGAATTRQSVTTPAAGPSHTAPAARPSYTPSTPSRPSNTAPSHPSNTAPAARPSYTAPAARPNYPAASRPSNTAPAPRAAPAPKAAPAPSKAAPAPAKGAPGEKQPH